MPRLFLVSLVRVCTRIRTPSFHLADVVILSISARFVPRNVARLHNIIQRWLASHQQRELGQHAFETCDAPKKLPVYFQHVFLSKKGPNNFPRIHSLLFYRGKCGDVDDPIYLNS